MKKWNSRSLKYGSYAFAATAVVVALIVIFNAVLGFDFIRDRIRFDVTKNRTYSLSEPSLEMLKTLNKDVDIIILAKEENFKTNEILEILKEYGLRTGGKVKYSFVDVVKNPAYIQKELDPEQVKGIEEGSIVVRSGDRMKVVSLDDMTEYDYSQGYPVAVGLKVEQVFSSAIKSVIADYTPVVYFTKGHSEVSPDSELSELKTSLIGNNYEVKDLALSEAVPDDAAVIIVASPKSDLLQEEFDNLMAYLEKGGDAVFLMDVQQNNADLKNFNMVFERYSLSLNNDQVIEQDQASYYQDVSFIIPKLLQNEVVSNLDPASLRLIMPFCRSINIAQVGKEWIKTNALFATTPNSYSTNLATGEQAQGPFVLGALSEYDGQDSSKVALIGNTTFVTNEALEFFGPNGKRYIVSILNWMEDKADSVLVPSKTLTSEPLNLSQQSQFVMFIIMVGILPLVIIGFGVFVWLRRKHL